MNSIRRDATKVLHKKAVYLFENDGYHNITQRKQAHPFRMRLRYSFSVSLVPLQVFGQIYDNPVQILNKLSHTCVYFLFPDTLVNYGFKITLVQHAGESVQFFSSFRIQRIFFDALLANFVISGHKVLLPEHCHKKRIGPTQSFGKHLLVFGHGGIQFSVLRF